ncbi:hypothetical protein DDZ13_06705 [Coraliomargarita sinensis]|uniref:ATP-grasp domain-containing protein n=1 Tax=Coraliomargarita sinensis TaxID=2174842 RepID=A0A317ZF79_9BACT|nr:ATP-grasp domain-containing protein [Coraliomargarita sinensis]PXA04224.1 hypothetical protein DDZ13_06705 [Coraliomargarita sinensis]
MERTAAKPRILLIYRMYSSSFTAYPWIFSKGDEVRVDVIAHSDHLIHKSAWVASKIKVGKNEDFLDRLNEHLSSVHYDDVLCVDEPARTMLLDSKGSAGIPEAYLPLSKRMLRERVAVDKEAFSNWCHSNSLPVPRSVIANSEEETMTAASEIGFPCVLKGVAGAGGQEVVVVRDELELASACSAMSGKTGWLVQEFIDGPVGTAIFVARKGQLYASCSFLNRHCTSRGIGPVAVCEPFTPKGVDDAISVVSRHVDGLTGFDWMRRKDGSIVLIDPHFGRLVPTGAVAHLAGVDLGDAYLRSLRGDTALESRTSINSSCIWVFPQCLQLILEGSGWAAMRGASPFRSNSRIFFCAPGESRMALSQFLNYLVGWTRVRLGALKQMILSR